MEYGLLLLRLVVGLLFAGHGSQKLFGAPDEPVAAAVKPTCAAGANNSPTVLPSSPPRLSDYGTALS